MRFLAVVSNCIALLLGAGLAVAQSVPTFKFTEAPGPHAVGLRVVEQYDLSRTYRPLTDDLGKPWQGERARPLQTLIWYPAEKNGGKRLTVGDYGDIWATETSFGKPGLDDGQKVWIKAMTPTLKDSMWAVRDAPLAPGRFPLVIYAPSFSAMAWENADLCEYLASFGYVVVASPDMGATARDMTADLPGVNAQARDISFMISYAQTLPDTEMSEIAVAGFSWGGISNLFAAARDNRIDALVALDGSMRYFPNLVKDSGDVHPEQMMIPLLFVAEGDISLEDQARQFGDKMQAPNVLNAWTHGDLVTVHMLGFVHTENSSMYQRNEGVWAGFPSQQKADYGREYGSPGYGWLARYTLNFLNAYLKHDAAAMTFLKNKPAQNGVPPHFLSVEFRGAAGAPATLEAFRAELGREGFDHAETVYAEMHKANPDFKLDEMALNGWGGRLLSEGHLPEAIDVLKLNASLHPDSGNVYDSLGEAYLKSGEKQMAMDDFKKSLAKDPKNEHAKQRLKELEAGAAVAK